MRSSLWNLFSLGCILIVLLQSFASRAAIAAPLPPTPCADLVVTGFTITPPMPVQGIDAQIAITVKNIGKCSSIPFVVQWKSDLLAPTGPSFQVQGLGPGASTTINLVYAFPRA